MCEKLQPVFGESASRLELTRTLENPGLGLGIELDSSPRKCIDRQARQALRLLSSPDPSQLGLMKLQKVLESGLAERWL